MFGKLSTAFGPRAVIKDENAERPKLAHVLRAEKRRQAMLSRAADMLHILPEPGESVHCLQTGYFDLLMCVPLLSLHYGPVAHARIVTLTYNGRNLTELCRLLDTQAVHRLTILCSGFFQRHNKELYQDSVRELRDTRGQRLTHGKNHAKVICLDHQSGVKLVLEGSANLRTNRSTEQVTLIRDDGLHDWHSTWIEEAVDRYGRLEDNGG